MQSLVSATLLVPKTSWARVGVKDRVGIFSRFSVIVCLNFTQKDAFYIIFTLFFYFLLIKVDQTTWIYLESPIWILSSRIIPCQPWGQGMLQLSFMAHYREMDNLVRPSLALPGCCLAKHCSNYPMLPVPKLWIKYNLVLEQTLHKIDQHQYFLFVHLHSYKDLKWQQVRTYLPRYYIYIGMLLPLFSISRICLLCVSLLMALLWWYYASHHYHPVLSVAHCIGFITFPHDLVCRIWQTFCTDWSLGEHLGPMRVRRREKPLRNWKDFMYTWNWFSLPLKPTEQSQRQF